VCLYDHALTDRGAASGHGAAGPFHFDQAHATGAVWFETGVVTEGGDVDARFARHFQDRLTGGCLDLSPVESESHQWDPGRLGGDGHHDLLTASNRHFS
jgi:hypothetical protein